MVKCSNSNCNYNMPTDYFDVHFKYEILTQKQINDHDIYDKIVDGLIKIELFCITCCVN